MTVLRRSWFGLLSDCWIVTDLLPFSENSKSSRSFTECYCFLTNTQRTYVKAFWKSAVQFQLALKQLNAHFSREINSIINQDYGNFLKERIGKRSSVILNNLQSLILTDFSHLRQTAKLLPRVIKQESIIRCITNVLTKTGTTIRKQMKYLYRDT